MGIKVSTKGRQKYWLLASIILNTIVLNIANSAYCLTTVIKLQRNNAFLSRKINNTSLWNITLNALQCKPLFLLCWKSWYFKQHDNYTPSLFNPKSDTFTKIIICECLQIWFNRLHRINSMSLDNKLYF